MTNFNIVPYPKNCTAGGECLCVKNGFIIKTDNSELLPLAEIVNGELYVVTGAESGTDCGEGVTNVALSIDTGLSEEAYTLSISASGAVIKGGSPRAVAWGTVTLLQLISIEDSSIKLPFVEISDNPDVDYRGMMLDLARNWHTVDVIKQCVELCRWYKIKYLHLHFTDDQSWTLPSNIFPNLPTPNRHYTFEQLNDLEEFATARGVTIIPEIDVPGHSQAIADTIPELVAVSSRTGNTVCPGLESTYQTLEKVFTEVCSVFKSAPYLHIGADEVDKTSWSTCEFCRAYKEENGIGSDEELYRHFIVRMHDIVTRLGKQTVVWEGFTVAGEIEIPKDITVMAFESHYEAPQNLVAAGYPVINTSWQPLYVVNAANWSPEKIYSWNMYRWEHFWEKSLAHPNGIDVEPASNIIGAQLCLWEQSADIEVSSARERLCALSERIWDKDLKALNFESRMKAADERLSVLL